MGICGRALKVGDDAVTEFNMSGPLARVRIAEADYTWRHGHSQSGTMFRVTPPLKNGTLESWYDADWFEPASPTPKTGSLFEAPNLAMLDTSEPGLN